MRAEFRVWHEGDELDFVMFDREAPKIPVPIKEFPIASASIQAVMEPLREALQTIPCCATSFFRWNFYPHNPRSIGNVDLSPVAQ